MMINNTINWFDRNIERYPHRTSKDLVCKKEGIKCNNIIKQHKNVYVLLNYKKDIFQIKKEHNPNWPEIPDHSYRTLIVGTSRSWKTNVLLNLIDHEPDKNYLCAKDQYEAKYQLPIKKGRSAVLKYLNDLKAFIEYSNDMDGIYNIIEEYNPNKKRKILIVFDDVIADVLCNKRLNPIMTELFIRGRKLNASLNFIIQSFFCCSNKY